MPLALGTDYLLKDEPCFGVFELDFQSPGNRGVHRYRIILVVRNDRIAEFRKDLGETKRFRGVDQFRIPGGVKLPNGKIRIVHTVGELTDIADELRYRRTLFDKKDLIGVNKIKE